MNRRGNLNTFPLSLRGDDDDDGVTSESRMFISARSSMDNDDVDDEDDDDLSYEEVDDLLDDSNHNNNASQGVGVGVARTLLPVNSGMDSDNDSEEDLEEEEDGEDSSIFRNSEVSSSGRGRSLMSSVFTTSTRSSPRTTTSSRQGTGTHSTTTTSAAVGATGAATTTRTTRTTRTAHHAQLPQSSITIDDNMNIEETASSLSSSTLPAFHSFRNSSLTEQGHRASQILRRKGITAPITMGNFSRNSNMTQPSNISMVVGSKSKKNRQNGSAGSKSSNGAVDTSIEPELNLARLDNAETGSDSITAAAAFVRETVNCNATTIKRFNQGDSVLVALNSLNHGIDGPESGEIRANSTIAPVNEYGYTHGEGRTEKHRKGPFIYVLAKVKSVHFEEDSVYYKVVRADSEITQRADTVWMRAIEHGTDGEFAAKEAARRKRDSDVTPEPKISCRNKVGYALRKLRYSLMLIKNRLMAHLQIQATKLLRGIGPYSCQIKLTSVHFLVLCSAWVCFSDQFRLAFLYDECDDAMHGLGCFFWSILVMELFFQVMIRPKDYSMRLASEKAYAPSTAQFINKFHLATEIIALASYLPEIIKLKWPISASIYVGWDSSLVGFFAGHFYFTLIRFRIIGLVRHWKNVYIRQFWLENPVEPTVGTILKSKRKTGSRSLEDQRADMDGLSKAATIGTALTLVNSHRALILTVLISGIVPLFFHKAHNNLCGIEMLQQGNIYADGDCLFLTETFNAWADTYDEKETMCVKLENPECASVNYLRSMCDDCPCEPWNDYVNKASNRFARSDAISNEKICDETGEYCAYVSYDMTDTVQGVNFSSFLLQISLLLLVLIWLSVLRYHANKLVITPLRRMLKIVLRYAKNPLAPPIVDNEEDHDPEDQRKDKLGSYETSQLITAIHKITDLLRKCWGVAGAEIITANLARNPDGDTVVFNPTVPGRRVYALFGFAGISDFTFLLNSLDREVMRLVNDVAQVVHDEVFRWGFNESGQCNKNLGDSFLMVYLIGDFEEVEKRLAAAEAVIFNKGKQAGNNNSNKSLLSMDGSNSTIGLTGRRLVKRARRRNKKNVNLASLPGINEFTDRALLGMLKSFAGINREKEVKKWEKDFRLGAGVGAFAVEMIFGMDAGWAVEGAVGSSYKIDATYLSPHVNLAARMKSACKQYGLTILMSEDVHELLSAPAKKLLRHVDTVMVKGVSEGKRIYTYDARYKGVDFFLYDKTEKHANIESNNYTEDMWLTDQDLKAMRYHISPEFEETFARGMSQYISGQWKESIENFKDADNIMLNEIIDQGVSGELGAWCDKVLDPNNNEEEVVRLRQEHGDGPAQNLIAFMEKEGGIAPIGWKGIRALTNK